MPAANRPVPPPLTAEEREDLEDDADNRAADEALAEMARTGEKARPLAEVLAELGLKTSQRQG